MRLQIRKKEKYLLISMILYLTIVSSALFLIFSPVSAYTLLYQHDTTSMVANASSTQGYIQQIQQNSTTKPLWNATSQILTKIEGTDLVLRREDTSFPASGSVAFQFRTAVSGSIIADGTWSWVVNGPSAGVSYPGSSQTYVIDNWYPVNVTATNTQIITKTNGHLFGTIESGYILIYTASDDVSWGGTYDANMYTDQSKYSYGTWKYYSGTSLPDVPVITNFTVEKSCYSPNESAILHADVTGTVDTWNWKVYDLNGTVISETSDPVDTVTDPLLVVGLLAAKVTVTNAGGTDDDYRTGFINVTQAGTCNFTSYNPFPTITVTPTQNVFVTMTMPPSVIVNITGVNDIINNSYLGNMSLGYRQYVDGIGEGFNTTLTGVVNVVQSPLTMVVNGIAEGVSLFTISINSLMSYTTIPLAIVGITLSYYPWQIITLITAGIAIDAAFVLIFGVR